MKTFKITLGSITWGATSNRFSGSEEKIVRGKSPKTVARRVLGTRNVTEPEETSTPAWGHGPQMERFPEGHGGNAAAVIITPA